MNTDRSPKVSYQPLIALVLFTLCWAVVFYDTLFDVIGVWMGSHTYNHCFFVLPIALFFAYEKDREILSVVTKPAKSAFFLLLGCQLLWLFGAAAHISLFQHIAVFAMLSSFVLFCYGWSVAKVIWFSLCFVVFAIPIGDELVPFFQGVTADLSLLFLNWSGVPVYRDGLFITIPAGHFEVAEACSGIRFFIACVVLGTVYAYANLRRTWVRLGFIVIAIILPILANGLRAYGTIMIGHYTDMKHAVGADHLIYGWGFFAFVIFILFVIGHFWQKLDADDEPQSDKAELSVHDSWLHRRWIVTALIGILPLLSSVFMSHILERGQQVTAHVSKEKLPGDQLLTVKTQAWLPDYNKASERYLGNLGSGIKYFVALYPVNSPDAELVSWENRAFRISHWRHDRADKIRITVADGGVEPVVVNEVVSPRGQRLLILSWYRLDGHSWNTGIETKLMQAANALMGHTAAGAFMAMAKPVSGNAKESQEQLINAFKTHYQTLNNAIIFGQNH